MAASYTVASRSAWSRMTRLLFAPFRIETWAVLGFAAFLSEQLSHPPSGGLRGSTHGAGFHLPEMARHAAAFLLHPVWGPLVGAIALCALITALVFLWLSSRGKFIFLDNVARERTAIVEPWKRFARQGNSLFVFWLVFNIVVVATVIAISLPLIPVLLHTIATGGGWPLLIAAFGLWWVAAMAPLMILAGCAYLFLFEFVVPIMYRDDLGVLAAWRRFFTLFGDHTLNVLGYVLFFVVLRIGAALLIVVAGFMSCCVGFILLSIPYVGAVITLPLEVWFRGLGPDFMAQLGPEWSVYARPGAAPATPPPGTPGA